MDEFKFKKGDLVQWFETFGDVYITKDQGTGVIVDITKLEYFPEPYYSYRVFRIEKNDYMIFEDHNLKKFKE